MSIRSLATVAVTAALLVAVPSGVALAADTEPANCADAVTLLASADAAHKAAVEADEAVVDAEAADKAFEDAKDVLKDATEDLRVARAELAEKQAVLDAVPPPTGQALKDAKAARDRAQDVLDDAEKVRKDAAEARDDAKEKAEATDVVALRAKAEETSAAALQVALDAARDDFNRLCTEGEDDPTDNGDSDTSGDTDDSVDTSSNDTVVTPSGGVNTGAGPA